MAQPTPPVQLLEYQQAFTKEEFQGDMVRVNRFFHDLIEAINLLQGNHGPSQLNNVLDMQGFQIRNVGKNKVTLG